MTEIFIWKSISLKSRNQFAQKYIAGNDFPFLLNLHPNLQANTTLI